MKHLLFAALPGLLLLACNKDAGEGGKAQITGRLLEQRVSASGNPIGDPYPALGENVYIIYGGIEGGAYPDDNVDSGPNGEFRFSWLRKGTYTVYAVSDCNDCDGGKKSVAVTVEVDDRKGSVSTGDILIERN